MIDVRALSKSLGGRRVLHDVSLAIPDGEVTCVIGRSGSGKSVLLRHLVRLLIPDAGPRDRGRRRE